MGRHSMGACRSFGAARYDAPGSAVRYPEITPLIPGDYWEITTSPQVNAVRPAGEAIAQGWPERAEVPQSVTQGEIRKRNVSS